MEPMQPLSDLSDYLHDKRHFVTPAGQYSAEELSAYSDVELITNLTERYDAEVRFSPSDVGVDLWSTPTERAVMEVIADIRTSEIDARPVYGFGFEGHWSLEPGSEAAHRQPLGDLAVPPASIPSDSAALDVGTLTSGTAEARHVAVIDAGFSGVLPPSRHHSSEILDADAMGIHGSLVLYLVELTAPDATIDYVSVPLLSQGMGSMVQPHWRRSVAVAAGDFPCTDDMAVAHAMRRAAEHGARCLNLSLGTYLAVMSLGSRPPEPVKPYAMEFAMDMGAELGVSVIVAAGNDDRGSDGQLFYPACREEAIAVGAANVAGQPQLWIHGQRVAASRSWWDYQAPGVDLCGAPFDTGDGGSFALRWSGSSFATALVTGRWAAGKSIGPSAGSSVHQIGYGDVPGLMYGLADGGVAKTAIVA